MTFLSGQESFARTLLASAPCTPDGLKGSSEEAVVSRFNVYRNNVFVGLTQALARRFPVTQRLVGADFFTGMARVYAEDHKPASPLLMDYGDDFPDFVRGFGPAAALGYLCDVARLEAAWTRAYHAADARPLEPADLAAIPPEALAAVRLAVHPSATLVASSHPVGSIWAAHKDEAVTPVVVATAPETVLLARPDLSVDVSILPARDAPFAAALFSGAPLGEAVEAALASDAAFEFGPAMVGLLQLGAFSSFSIAEGHVQ